MLFRVTSETLSSQEPSCTGSEPLIPPIPCKQAKSVPPAEPHRRWLSYSRDTETELQMSKETKTKLQLRAAGSTMVPIYGCQSDWLAIVQIYVNIYCMKIFKKYIFKKTSASWEPPVKTVVMDDDYMFLVTQSTEILHWKCQPKIQDMSIKVLKYLNSFLDSEM